MSRFEDTKISFPNYWTFIKVPTIISFYAFDLGKTKQNISISREYWVLHYQKNVPMVIQVEQSMKKVMLPSVKNCGCTSGAHRFRQPWCLKMTSVLISKGQLISKGLIGVLTFTKKKKELFLDFCPNL